MDSLIDENSLKINQKYECKSKSLCEQPLEVNQSTIVDIAQKSYDLEKSNADIRVKVDSKDELWESEAI